MAAFISICIPAYKRTNYLRRLLLSIADQTFSDYEIILTDDSPGEEVLLLCLEFAKKLSIQYYKNNTALGTPENWNEAIQQASGQWIKIMHDDDWFTAPDSLATFATAAQQNENNFIFSAYHFVQEKDESRKLVKVNAHDLARLRRDPFYLYRTNYIGNPSCTLFRKKTGIAFDSRFKWVVDFEFYIRYLTTTGQQLTYIDTPLVNVGLNDTQVTTYTFRVATVEVPENHLMLAGQGFRHLKSIFVYDYFWRLYRNLDITLPTQLATFGYSDELPTVLASMIGVQKKIPRKWLHWGPISKTIMFLHYLAHRKSIW